MEKEIKFPREKEVWLVDFTTNFAQLNSDFEIEKSIKKLRPVIIVSDNLINEFNSDVFVVPLTSIIESVKPYQVFIKKDEDNGLEKDSKALVLQMLLVNKEYRLKKRLGEVAESTFNLIINEIYQVFSKRK